MEFPQRFLMGAEHFDKSLVWIEFSMEFRGEYRIESSMGGATQASGIGPLNRRFPGESTLR
jgi:hypothetical protein